MDNLATMQSAMRSTKSELVRNILMRAYWHSVNVTVAGDSAVAQYYSKLANQRKNVARNAKAQAYRDCGLVRVRGALGGIYWE